jgi:hypothetical protein
MIVARAYGRFLPTMDGSQCRGYSNLCFVYVHLWLKLIAA